MPSDIALLGAQDLARVGPINLVIAGWPCQGHTWASCGEDVSLDLVCFGRFVGVTPSSYT